MDTSFHYDPTEYQGQVARIAEHVVSSVGDLPTLAPRIVFESNSYHGTAIKAAEQARLSRLYPRLYR